MLIHCGVSQSSGFIKEWSRKNLREEGREGKREGDEMRGKGKE
jgi:hypothetical protein